MLLILFLLLLILFLIKTQPENFQVSNNITITNSFIINLDSEKERLSEISNMLNREMIPYERFPAILGKELDLDSEKCNTYFSDKGRKTLKLAQMGCSLSHITIWEKVANNNNPDDVFLILEDDAIIPEDFNEKLKTYSKQLPDNWEMLLLGTNSMIGKKHSENLLYTDKTIKKNGNYGLYAYLIKPKTAKKLLKSCQKMSATIDHYLNKKFYLNNRVYFCMPSLVTHNYDLRSSIFERVRTNDKRKNEIVNIVK
jgi:GR25 family glycosyltransferase involved in LPS biosynthesis